MARTKKRTTAAAKPAARAKARSTSKGVASSRSKARQDTDLAPIVRFTPKQRAAYLERQTQREMGISVAEFRRAFAAGELDNLYHAVRLSPPAKILNQARTEAKLPRSASEGVAQSLAQHLNRVVNWIVTDLPLFVEPITGHDGDAFELTRVTWLGFGLAFSLAEETDQAGSVGCEWRSRWCPQPACRACTSPGSSAAGAAARRTSRCSSSGSAARMRSPSWAPAVMLDEAKISEASSALTEVHA